MALVVEAAGPLATVQDLGRPGARAWGVPPGGAFDRDAHALANALVGNPEGDATLELTLLGGTFRAEADLAIALAGAAMRAHIDGFDGGRRTLLVPQSARLRAGDRLVLGGMRGGARAYLAVQGGWQVPLVLGSRSSEAPLKAGDRLPCRAPSGGYWTRRPAFDVRRGLGADPIRVIAGPEAAGPFSWEGRAFTIDPRSDRMGLRLDGPAPAVVSEPDRPSAPVAPGAVQVAGGRLIVLGPACGTMGGYPVVAHVISADLGRLGQARPGDAIGFEEVDLAEARRLDAAHRRTRAAWIARTTALCRDGGTP